MPTKKWEIVVSCTWTYTLEGNDPDSLWEAVAQDLHKCTIENSDDGFFVEEPVEIKEEMNEKSNNTSL